MGNFVAFILLLGPLIFIHELGHLLAAKLVDVKVRRFSIGFGPPLVRVHFGETEYCIAPIPLGGYVSLLGQNPYEEIAPQDTDRALNNKRLWARYLVLAAGPLANILLPVLLYFFFFLAQTHTAPPVFGTVMADSAAAAAELQPGDRIITIEDRDIGSWEDMRVLIGENPDREVKVQIEREDRTKFFRYVTPRRTLVANEVGVLEPRGLLGVYPWFYRPQIGIVDFESRAYRGGLRTGDVITSINGEPVATIGKLEELLKRQKNGLLRVTYLRAHETQGPLGTYRWLVSNHAELLPQKRPIGAPTPELGLLAANTFLDVVEEGSPAALAGLKSGDRIVAVDGTPLHHWEGLVAHLARRGETPFTLTVQTPGEEARDVTLAQAIKSTRNAYGQRSEYLWLGATPYSSRYLSKLEPIRGRMTYALRSAIGQVSSQLAMIGTLTRQMITLERGVEDLSSVVGLFNFAGTAAKQGPGEFMQLLALFSLQIGFINLLPIPILDGGHLLFFTIEAIRRRPLGQRAREIASTIGLMFLVILTLVAVRNDLMRLLEAP
jgi:regulator of sigma E protease